MTSEPQATPDPFAPRDPTQVIWPKRLAVGASYVPRGIRFAFHRPGLLVYCAIPALINIVLFAVALGLLLSYGGDLKDWLFGLMSGEHHWALQWLIEVGKVLIWVIYLLLCLVLAFVIVYIGGNILASPFNDMLSERTEEAYTGRPAPPFGLKRFLHELRLGITEELKRVFLYLLIILILLPLDLIPVVGSIIHMILGGAVTAWFLTLEYVSLPMARRHYHFGDRARAVKSNLALSTGFGLLVAGMLWVPLLNFFMIPIAAVGGTLLYCDLQFAGALPRAPDGTPPGPYVPDQPSAEALRPVAEPAAAPAAAAEDPPQAPSS